MASLGGRLAPLPATDHRLPKTATVTPFHNSNPLINEFSAQEEGGVNLYGFANNKPITAIDIIGLIGFKDVKITLKSFIEDGIVLGTLGNPIPDRLMWLFSKLVDLKENPFNSKRDGYYRLYSSIYLPVCCSRGKLSVLTDRNTIISGLKATSDVGLEKISSGLVIKPPAMEFKNMHFGSTHRGEKFLFRWSGRGRPHNLAESGFQTVQFRRNRYIWHNVFGHVSCSGDNVVVNINQFDGSIFPAHRVYVDMKNVYEKDYPLTFARGYIPQGVLADLWRLNDWR